MFSWFVPFFVREICSRVASLHHVSPERTLDIEKIQVFSVSQGTHTMYHDPLSALREPIGSFRVLIRLDLTAGHEHVQRVLSEHRKNLSIIFVPGRKFCDASFYVVQKWAPGLFMENCVLGFIDFRAKSGSWIVSFSITDTIRVWYTLSVISLFKIFPKYFLGPGRKSYSAYFYVVQK